MQTLILKWFYWQFIEVSKNILEAWRNFLRFGLNYFSTPTLIKTFFSPWKRYKMFYPKGFSFGVYSEVFFSNLIFRVLGAIFRSVLIVMGVFFEIFIFLAGFLIFIGWLILPVFLILGIYHGFRLLF